MEEYKEITSLESILYALLKCKDTFFNSLAEYNKNNSSEVFAEKSIAKEITKVLPLKYRILLRTFGSLPVEETIDIVSGMVKEFFKTEFENKTTKEALDEFLSKYLKGG